MSRPVPQPLQAEISRRTVKTMHLKLSEYLDKNAFYHYEGQLIGFSLNCCTRKCNRPTANNPRPIVENIWYWIWGTLSPMHKRLKFLGCTMHNRTVKYSLWRHKLIYSDNLSTIFFHEISRSTTFVNYYSSTEIKILSSGVKCKHIIKHITNESRNNI